MIYVFRAISNVVAGENNPKQLFQKAVNLRNNTRIFRICGRIQRSLYEYVDWKSSQSQSEKSLNYNGADTDELFETFETDPFWIQQLSQSKNISNNKMLVYNWMAQRLKEAARLNSDDSQANLTHITGQQLFSRFRKFAFAEVLEDEFSSDGIWLLFAVNGVDPLWKMSTWSEQGVDRVSLLRFAVKRFLHMLPSARDMVKNIEEMLIKEISLEGTIKPLFHQGNKANPVYWDGIDISNSKDLPAQIWDRLRSELSI